MDSNVKLIVAPGGELSMGYCELSSGCKISVESQSNLRIGDGVFFNRGCTIVSKAGISIGEDTIFGENVKLFDHDHMHHPRLEKNIFKSKEINIGKGCWFGSNVVILKGVSVGDNTTIGANCVLSRNVPPNTVLTTTSDYHIRSK